jgi:Holliday junction resolvase-like predicted endonuclease
MNLGKYGEGVAKNYLKSKNYEMVAENFRHERAEVDLIFKDEKKTSDVC